MLSEFQLALLAAAALVILVLWAVNHYQDKRYRERAERAFRHDHPDVLFETTTRREPVLGELAKAAAEPAPAAAPDFNDDFENDVPVLGAQLAPQGHAGGVDAQLDSIALVLAEEPIQLERLKPYMERSRRLGANVCWEGLVGGMWEPLLDSDFRPGGGLKELRVGLQLASRDGALRLERIAAYHALVGEMAAGLSAVAQREAPAVAEDRARTLDEFCAETDIEIAVNVVGLDGATFSPAKVRAVIASESLEQIASGRYAKLDSGQEIVFTLRSLEANEPAGIDRNHGYLTGLTFAFDVPLAADGQAVLRDLLACAERFAQALGGQLVDDHKKPLSAAGREAIGGAVADIVDLMTAFGVMAGSPAARRLYA